MNFDLGTIDKWIASHQALIVAVGVPSLTAVAAGLVAWLTNRANLAASQRQRLLEKELKLAEFRQIWINGLRDDLALYCAAESRLWRAGPAPDISNIVEIGSRVLMRMNTDDPDFDTLARTLSRALDYAGKSREELKDLDEKHESTEATVVIGQRILKREWERIKFDLRAVEK